MKLRPPTKNADVADDTDDSDLSVDAVDDTDGATVLTKGRPTPKRRESQGKRGPVRAPQTRKEAVARQRQLAKEQRTTKKTSVKPRTAAEQRAALKRGDADALPRRDQGNTRKIARDWVDSRRMLSNYLLWLFPLMIIPIVVPALAFLQIAVLVLLVVFIVEWFLTGRKIRALAHQRHGAADGSNLGIGFYAGSRAYLPRRWRLPGPQVERGDEI